MIIVIINIIMIIVIITLIIFIIWNIEALKTGQLSQAWKPEGNLTQTVKQS